MSKGLNNIEFIQAMYDVSWILMDYVRDKRQAFEPDKPVQPRKGVPQEVLQAVVNLNTMTGQVLRVYHTPVEDFEGEVPEEIIDTIDLSPNSE